MKRLTKITFMAMAMGMSAGVTVSATTSVYDMVGQKAPEMVMINGVPQKFDSSTYVTFSEEEGEKNTVVAEVNAYGQLESEVGDRALTADILVVRGPVDETDFEFMRDCCFYGRTTDIDLSEAQLKDRKVPDKAFWALYNGTSYFLPLSSIVLPDDIEEIGNTAFYSTFLRTVNLPASLKKIGEACFCYCPYLSGTVEIPENVTEIPRDCFQGCRNIDIDLPSTLKVIGKSAFYNTNLKEIDLPAGVESIGKWAFGATLLTKVDLPVSCTYGEEVFDDCYYLAEISFPEGAVTVPSGVCSNLGALVSVKLPSSVRYIEPEAFVGDAMLTSIELPEGLLEIRDKAFFGSSLKSVVLPSTMEYVAPMSFANCSKLKEIYSLNSVAPLAQDRMVNGDNANPRPHIYAFGDEDYTGTPQTIPVYIPAGSKKSYESGFGWQWFTNFIETDKMPTGIEDIFSGTDDTVKIYVAGGDLCIEASDSTEYSVYGIDGRKVACGVVSGGTTVNLPAGLYIVKAGVQTKKVIL